MNQWAINGDQLKVQDGRPIVDHYIDVVEGGKDGDFMKEIIDYFYYAQIRSQGEETTAKRKIEGKIPFTQVRRRAAAPVPPRWCGGDGLKAAAGGAGDGGASRRCAPDGGWRYRGRGGGGGRDVVERPYTAGGGGAPPPPPTLPMFEADSQNFASAPSVPRGFRLQNFWPAFGGDHRGTPGGGGSPANPPPPLSNTSLGGRGIL